MTALILVCVALVILLVALLFWPAGRHAAQYRDQRGENLDWYRLRREELAAQDPSLAEDADLRLLEDESQGAAEGEIRSNRFPRWMLVPLWIAGAVWLYWMLGSAPDVMITRQLENLNPDMPAAEVAAFVRRVETRSRQRPGNADYLAIIGRHAMGREDYVRASEAYGKLLDLRPDDPSALAYAAQAEYLAAGRTLTPSARERATQALAVDPHQETALSLLGMAAFEAGEFSRAIEYWEQLLARVGSDSAQARVLASVIRMAREQSGEESPSSGAGEAVEEETGVSVRVALPRGVTPSADATVFVFARPGGAAGGMPLAARRLSAAQLPVTLRLTDADSMAGGRLSSVASVDVSVQISPSGRPGEAFATHIGTARGLAPSSDEEPVAIEIRPVEE